MEDAIPLIFQQLPATTGFVQSRGHFFRSFSCQTQTRVTGGRKEEREEGKGGMDILRLKSELKLATYLSWWEFFNSNKLKKIKSKNIITKYWTKDINIIKLVVKLWDH